MFSKLGHTYNQNERAKVDNSVLVTVVPSIKIKIVHVFSRTCQNMLMIISSDFS